MINEKKKMTAQGSSVEMCIRDRGCSFTALNTPTPPWEWPDRPRWSVSTL